MSSAFEPFRMDVVNVDTGGHQYWSTYCRHAKTPDDPLHAQCKGECKICASPCACPHHREG